MYQIMLNEPPSFTQYLIEECGRLWYPYLEIVMYTSKIDVVEVLLYYTISIILILKWVFSDCLMIHREVISNS